MKRLKQILLRFTSWVQRERTEKRYYLGTDPASSNPLQADHSAEVVMEHDPATGIMRIASIKHQPPKLP